jgi:hypothetical protein
MPRRLRIIFFAGSVLYIGSFFLMAVYFTKGQGILLDPLRGWECANIALVHPWESSALSNLSDAPFAWTALMLSGLINPIFLLTAIRVWRQGARREFLTLAVIVLIMIPFCWVVFHDAGLRPREGYFLWILGMILVLFSGFCCRRQENLFSETLPGDQTNETHVKRNSLFDPG